MYRTLLASVSALAICAAPAFAQSADVGESDEIVVTVQKRAQSVLEVPLALTAYDGDFLEDLGVAKFDELSAFVPGLQVQEQSANNPGFVIRGITSDSGEANIEPRVALFQDGVSMSRSRGSYVELFDMERIEIAKGPQPTLFGRGALIGGINLIQNKADVDTFALNGTLEAGEDGYLRGVGVVNVPLAEGKAGVRFAATRRERDGYIENELGGEDFMGVEATAARFALGLQPSDVLRFDLILNYQDDNNSGTSFKSGTFAPPSGNLTPFDSAALNTFGGFLGGEDLGLDREVRSAQLNASWDINEMFTLTSITGYRDFESLEVFDPDGSLLELTIFAEDAEGEQLSQEFRINFDNGGRFTGFAGVSYFHEEGTQSVPLLWGEQLVTNLFVGNISSPTPQSAAFLTSPAVLEAVVAGLGIPGFYVPAVAAALKGTHGETFTNTGETDSFDIFADGTFAVTERFEISAGLRWTRDEKTTGYGATLDDGTGSVLGTIIALPSLPPADQLAVLDFIQAFGVTPLDTGLFVQPTGGTAEASDTFDDFTWRAVARYEITDRSSVWASYARGRRPEVLSPVAPAAPFSLGGVTTFEVVAAETVDSYEIGAKGRFMDGRLDLDGSVFYYQYENFQTSEFQGVSLVTVNAGEASATGFEGSARFEATKALDLFATYAYNHARFDTGARDGNQFRLSPDHSFSIGATYTHPIAAYGQVRFTPTYTWQSEVFFDDDNDRSDLQATRASPAFYDFVVDEKQDAYGLLNARLSFEHTSGHWEAYVFAKNLLDEDYIIDAGNTGDSFGIPTFIAGAPRLIGGGVTLYY